MFKTNLRLLLVSTGLLFVSPAWAEGPQDIYQVDVIVFEQLDPKRFDAEVWPKSVGKLDTANAIQLSGLKDESDAVEVLDTLNELDMVGKEPAKKVAKTTVDLVDKNRMKLNEEANILRNSKTARLLQQVAWMQPMSANVKSTPVLIQAKEVTALVDVKPVRGQFSIDIDMIYNSSQGNRQGIKEFRIKKEIRTKKREIFYVDHPLVGMMIMVSPVVAASDYDSRP